MSRRISTANFDECKALLSAASEFLDASLKRPVLKEKQSKPLPQRRSTKRSNALTVQDKENALNESLSVLDRVLEEDSILGGLITPKKSKSVLESKGDPLKQFAKAVVYGWSEQLEAVITSGVSPNSIISSHLLLCSQETTAIVDKLAEMNAIRPSSEAVHAIHLAAQMGHVSCIQVLSNFGADVNIRSVASNISSELSTSRQLDECTALHRAAYHGKLDCCKVLVENGASILARDDFGNTPAAYGIIKKQTQIASYLLRLMEDINICNHAGEFLLYLSCYHGLNTITFQLLSRGSCPFQQSPVTKQTPMHAAIRGGHVSCVLSLLENVSPHLKKNESGNTTYFARLFGEQDRGGNTVLHTALLKGDDVIIRILLLKGAFEHCTQKRNKSGLSPFDMIETSARKQEWLGFIQREDKAISLE